MSADQLTGSDESFLCHLDEHHRLHPQAAAALQRLQLSASKAGFDLQPVSCFRSFERQLAIWNQKAGGQRPVLDSSGNPLRRDELDDWAWVQAILRWSALPGASRHHWGSDLDVYDAAAVPADYAVQLTPDEVNVGGPFAALHEWLDARIAEGSSEGFFRPYAFDSGGVAPERWHLSYAPIAAECERQLTIDCLLARIRGCETFALREVVEEHCEEIFERFVKPAQAAITQDAFL
ncbi:M15 family metallopeptidase [Litorivivens sp.]|uniref:M15 family metallopeptidase n=1 Tax=Litorivivens sp. TaxID=2020868 RepID=UPI0035683617